MHRSTSCMAVVVVLLGAGLVQADTFGTGGNVFDIEFVTISGSTNPTDTSLSGGFGVVDADYRIGVLEITNDQWDKFQAELHPVTVTGNPSLAYDLAPIWPSAGVATNAVSWYEAAQFVNWLNTSTNHPPAYNFTGTQGTPGYALAAWGPAEAAGGTNLYRHKDAFYFLPTEDEWVKAAYFNGTTLQLHATKPGETLYQGNGSNGGWNYEDGDPGPDGPDEGPWNVGSGSEELNGTHDMMGNVWEWMESPANPGYDPAAQRVVRGGAWIGDPFILLASHRSTPPADQESQLIGFRVASVPEPGSVILLVCGAAGLLLYRRHRRA